MRTKHPLEYLRRRYCAYFHPIVGSYRCEQEVMEPLKAGVIGELCLLHYGMWFEGKAKTW